MSQVLRKVMTPEDFLAWEATQELKWEFDGFQPVAMVGATLVHAAIQGNIIIALGNRLRGRPCRPFGSDVKVQIGPRYRYPDVLVSCSPTTPGVTVAADPVVIFEVLSESTARTDKTTKLTEYCSLPSVQRYAMLEQDQAFATVVSRTATGWGLETLGADGVLSMPEIGVEVPMAELYEGLNLAPLDL